MSIINVKDLVKVYSSNSIEVQALRGISFSIEKQAFISIMGPSGSGKSTLLNILGAVDRPTAGIVEVEGQMLNNLTEKKRDSYRLVTVGYVFQDLNLIPTLTACENVQLPMIALNRPKAFRRQHAVELLNLVGLADRTTHFPDQMSGGERQRVAIAAALANNPPIILADEPTGVLDSTNALQVIGYLRDTVEKLEKTVIMVTHDSSMARKTDRIYQIRDGQIDSGSIPSDEGYVTSKRYDQFLMDRASELRQEISALDAGVSANMIDGPYYCKERHHLLNTLKVLEGELGRMGFISKSQKK